MPSNVRGEITYQCPNFNCCTVKIWEWITNFIKKHCNEYIYISMLRLKLNHISKRMSRWAEDIGRSFEIHEPALSLCCILQIEYRQHCFHQKENCPPQMETRGELTFFCRCRRLVVILPAYFTSYQNHISCQTISSLRWRSYCISFQALGLRSVYIRWCISL